MTTTYTSSDFAERLILEVKGLRNYLVDDDYVNAMNDAENETGFALPLVDNTYEFYWYKERAKRHLFFYLYSESAHKFKVDQINLQHRFDHYSKMIASLDKRFTEEIEANPHKFASVSASHLFGSKVDAGFAYDDLGKDITYDIDQLVIVAPTESD